MVFVGHEPPQTAARRLVDISRRLGVRWALADGITGRVVYYDPTGKMAAEVPELDALLPAIELILRGEFADQARALSVPPQRVAFSAYLAVREAQRKEWEHAASL